MLQSIPNKYSELNNWFSGNPNNLSGGCLLVMLTQNLRSNVSICQTFFNSSKFFNPGIRVASTFCSSAINQDKRLKNVRASVCKSREIRSSQTSFKLGNCLLSINERKVGRPRIGRYQDCKPEFTSSREILPLKRRNS